MSISRMAHLNGHWPFGSSFWLDYGTCPVRNIRNEDETGILVVNTLFGTGMLDSAGLDAGWQLWFPKSRLLAGCKQINLSYSGTLPSTVNERTRAQQFEEDLLYELCQ